ncbi:hypothetical protein F4810DRAFT_681872, partial [Camillea tinctor]
MLKFSVKDREVKSLDLFVLYSFILSGFRILSLAVLFTTPCCVHSCCYTALPAIIFLLSMLIRIGWPRVESYSCPYMQSNGQV